MTPERKWTEGFFKFLRVKSPEPVHRASSSHPLGTKKKLPV